jgi:hypothetical protein
MVLVEAFYQGKEQERLVISLADCYLKRIDRSSALICLVRAPTEI